MKRKVKGVISIFLVLIMVPMYTLAGLIVDGSRISAAKTTATGAGDLAMNAALSDYDRLLNEMYGLFAISSNNQELAANVKKYFKSTLEGSAISGEDNEYVQKFLDSLGDFIVEADSNQTSFDNIVKTMLADENGSFTFTGIEESSIGNPAVLENQIIEHMKYRGPVSLASGFLTKIKCLGETSKQTKVVESKAAYDEQLDTIQDLCKSAYRRIETYNLMAENVDNATRDLGDSNSWNDGTMYGDVSKHLYNMACLQIIINTIDKARNNGRGFPSLSDATLTEAYLESEYIIEGEVEYARLIDDIKNVYWGHKTDGKTSLEWFNAFKNYLQNGQTNINTAIYADYSKDVNYNEFAEKVNQATLIANQRCIQFANIYVIGRFLTTEAAGVDMSNQEGVSMDTYREITRLHSDLKNFFFRDYNLDIFDIIEQNAYSHCEEAAETPYELLFQIYEMCSNTLLVISMANNALDEIIENCANLESLANTWRGNITQLTDSDIKDTMQTDFDNAAEGVKTEDVEKLKNLLKSYEEHYIGLIEYLESYLFYSKNKESEKKVVFSIPNGNDGLAGYLTALSELRTNTYSSRNINAYDVLVGQAPEGSAPTVTTENDTFFKFLDALCQSKSTADETAQENATNTKDNIKAHADEALPELSGFNEGNYIEMVPADIINAINEYNNCSDAGEMSYSKGGTDSDDKTMSQNARNNLNTITTLLEGLEGIVEKGRDNLYLEEYFTEMFSCYTSGMTYEMPNGRKIETSKFSLSGIDMSEKDALYRSEVEYLVFGCDSAAGNVAAAKALLFGIRFALNTVFAFTNGTTRHTALGIATAIAGWTGFGVPLVQTVVLFLMSMAESVWDVKLLCDGAAVSIYKSNDTWVMGPQGIKKAVVDLASDAAEVALDCVTDKINELAEDKIGDASVLVEGYVESTIDSLTASITNTITISIENIAKRVLGTNETLTKEKIDGMVNQMIADLKKLPENDGSKLSEVQKALFDRLDVIAMPSGKSFPQDLSDKLYSWYSQNLSVDALNAAIIGYINTTSETIKAFIKNKLQSLTTTLQDKVSEAIETGGSAAKEAVNNAIDEFTCEIGFGSETTPSTTLSSALSMTYKEYMKVFVLLKTISSEQKDAMLKRCAHLIQINVSGQDGASHFNVANAPTMVRIDAKIKVKTTFMNIFPVDGDGSVDFSRIGSQWQEFSYRSTIGY